MCYHPDHQIRHHSSILCTIHKANSKSDHTLEKYTSAVAAAVAAGSTSSSTGSSNANSSQTPPPQSPLVRDYWYELKFSDLFKFINPDGRYQCPRFNCLKSYKDASSLQRHIRYECGGQKKFRCLMCGKAFSQSSHLKRHLESGVCVKYYL